MARNTWRGLSKVSGSRAGKTSIRVYVCRGCGLRYETIKPVQCSCGRMDFTSFDSKGEANRWARLEMMERAGMISELTRQVRFPLMATRIDGLQVKVAEYVADFCYIEKGEQVIEDFKGGITDVASLKLRWMEAVGLPVRISTAKGL